MTDFHTEQQKKARLRTQHYIEREQLCSVMNDTKWREAIEVLEAIPNFYPVVRFKLVRDEPCEWHFWEDFRHEVGRPSAIEWLEIDPVQVPPLKPPTDGRAMDYSDQIMEALQSVQVPYTHEEFTLVTFTSKGVAASRERKAIRIWGYTRPGATPEFARSTTEQRESLD
jgi:hypothetical protein